MVKKVLLWLAVIFVSLMIFGFSATDGNKSKNLSVKVTEKVVHMEKSEEIDENISFKAVHALIRKSGHFFEFALLGVLTLYLARSYNLSLKMCLLISLLYTLFFAMGDEIHQLFVDGRDGRVTDVLIDFCGSLLFTTISYLKLKRKEKNS